jgi:PhnB protein
MLADEHPEIGALSPQSRGGTSVSILLYVEDADNLTNKRPSRKAESRAAQVPAPPAAAFFMRRMVMQQKGQHAMARA